MAPRPNNSLQPTVTLTRRSGLVESLCKEDDKGEMPLIAWIIAYALNMLFWLWIVRWGGAERLEGTFSSGLLISVFAPKWSAEGIKVFGYGAIIVSTIGFVLGVFFPDFRYFL